jgi:putative zinc finger protein
MDCRIVQDYLSTYLDHAVPLQMRLALEQHFDSCPQCCTELAHLEMTTILVRDLPRLQPSPRFLQQVQERVEHLAQRSRQSLFRRLVGAVPLQIAAAMALVVSAAIVWQSTPQLWRGRTAEVVPTSRMVPWSVHQYSGAPLPDPLPFEPPFEEPHPSLAPLVQAQPQRGWGEAREEFVRFGHEPVTGPLLGSRRGHSWSGLMTPSPSLILRATDPLQTAQQIWELVPSTGGELLQSQGLITPADHSSWGAVKLTLAIPANRYPALLEAIHRLPGTSVGEERMAALTGEAPGSLWYVEPTQDTDTRQMTLIIAIVRR